MYNDPGVKNGVIEDSGAVHPPQYVRMLSGQSRGLK